MNIIDEVLSRHKTLSGRPLEYKDLKPNEREYLNTWLATLNNNELTVQKIKEYVSGARNAVEQSLTDSNESPTTWLSLLSLLIPLVGIIRKWYADQRQVEQKARLRNYVLLEALLSNPDRAKEELDRKVAAFAGSIK